MIEHPNLLSSRVNARDLANFGALILVRNILRSKPDWRGLRVSG